MDLRLNGKTAIVTGASRGVGLATVRALAAEGVRVLGAARTITAGLREAAATAVSVDLSTGHGAEELITRATGELGGIDLLVNNVGGGDVVDLGGFLDLDDEHWRQTFDLNLFAAIRVSRAALPGLIERRGAVVNVSSIGAWQPAGPPLAYNVAKAALKAFGKGLAAEFGPRGVRVTTVSPGPVRTAIWEGPDGIGAKLAAAAGVPHQEFLADVPAMMGTVTGRITEPEEVADLITFLLSDAAGNITGSDHLIDGGIIRVA
jgi:NAD(P)-dependent dehydrogenase (short-subunit alcohol dehydrogenase family)